MKMHFFVRVVLALFSAAMLFISCEKSSVGGDGLKGYWMSDRNFYDCKRVYYFDGRGGGLLYSYLSTDSTNWNRDCDCHRYNTEYVGEFNGKKYYKQKDAGMDALVYVVMGTSVMVSTSGGENLEYLTYTDGQIAGYKKVTKR